jgi:hypothetical protein
VSGDTQTHGERADRFRLPDRPLPSSRTLLDRFELAMPRASLWFRDRAGRKLRPGSRVRRWSLMRIYRNGYAALSRGDVPLVLHNYHPEAEIEQPFELPDVPRWWRGHAGIAEGVKGFNESFSELRIAPVELLDMGDRLAARLEIAGTGGLSGANVDMPMAQAQWLDSGAIRKQRNFQSWEEALEAVGARAGEPLLALRRH